MIAFSIIFSHNAINLITSLFIGIIMKLNLGSNEILSKIRSALAENLRSALSVAGENIECDESLPIKKMSWAALSEKTGIAKSTIAKLLDNKKNGNPDLATLCRLAEALNVPPAFLLMTPADWNLITQTLPNLSTTSGWVDNYLTNAVSRTDKVQIGIEIAKKLSLYSGRPKVYLELHDYAGVKKPEMDKLTRESTIRQRLSILTITAMIQHAARGREATAILTSIAAIFGANFNPHK